MQQVKLSQDEILDIIRNYKKTLIKFNENQKDMTKYMIVSEQISLLEILVHDIYSKSELRTISRRKADKENGL